MLYKHRLQFSPSLGDRIPRATVGHGDNCSSVWPGLPPSITKSHGGTTLGTARAHSSPSRWAGADDTQGQPSCFIQSSSQGIYLGSQWGFQP